MPRCSSSLGRSTRHSRKAAPAWVRLRISPVVYGYYRRDNCCSLFMQFIYASASPYPFGDMHIYRHITTDKCVRVYLCLCLMRRPLHYLHFNQTLVIVIVFVVDDSAASCR